MNKIPRRERLGIKFFSDRQYKKFCMSLRFAGVPFQYHCFNIVILHETRFADLPDTLQNVIVVGKEKGLLQTTVEVPRGIFYPKLRKLDSDDAKAALQGLIDHLLHEDETNPVRKEKRTIRKANCNAACAGKFTDSDAHGLVIDFLAFRASQEKKSG